MQHGCVQCALATEDGGESMTNQKTVIIVLTNQVLWDNVKCDTDDEVTTKPSRIHLSAPLIRDLPGEETRVIIVLWS